MAGLESRFPSDRLSTARARARRRSKIVIGLSFAFVATNTVEYFVSPETSAAAGLIEATLMPAVFALAAAAGYLLVAD